MALADIGFGEGLKDKGALSAEEFDQAKAELLA